MRAIGIFFGCLLATVLLYPFRWELYDRFIYRVDPPEVLEASMFQGVDSIDIQKLSVSHPNCGPGKIFDSGKIIYVILDRNCNLQSPFQLNFHDQSREAVVSGRLEGLTLSTEYMVRIDSSKTRILSVHLSGTWRRIPVLNQWAWRDGAGLLVKDGSIFLLGGWNSEVGLMNDVWSSNDVRNWKLINPNADWAPRHGAGWVMHKNRMYVVSGDLHEDVWSSYDGVNWRLENQKAPFGKRYAPSVASHANALYIFGGQTWGPDELCAHRPECVPVGVDGVWKSTDGGVNWEQISAKVSWPLRGLIHGAAVKGRLFMIGGGLKVARGNTRHSETFVEYNDVWSSIDGIEWKNETTDAGFSPRSHLTVLGTDTGCFVAGGSVVEQLETTNEVYFSSDCVKYALVPGYEPIGKRHAASLVEFNGSILLLGGHKKTAGTTIWQYFL